MYAPTFHAPGDKIRCFYDDLKDVLNGIPREYLLLLLGDFNVYIGVRDSSMIKCVGTFWN